MSTLDKEVKRARQMYERNRRNEALQIANQLIADYPLQGKVWHLRAYLFEMDGLRNEAISDLDHAIALNPTEVLYLFNRAFNCLQLGKWQRVVSDCADGLELTNKLTTRNEYYSDVFHLFRAEALISLGQKAKAKDDLLRVNAEGKMWTNQLRTKSELLMLCD